MTELRTTKAITVAVEQGNPLIGVRKAVALGVEQTPGLIAVRKLNAYIVEQPVQDAQVVKVNVYGVEQPILDLRAYKTSVYVVEQRPPDMWYRTANPGDTPVWYGVTETAPPAWWKIAPWVNTGAQRITEAGDTRITEDGQPRRVEPGTPVATWVEPLATYVFSNGQWYYVRGPNSPLFEPP